jgi:hypothetical protein
MCWEVFVEKREVVCKRCFYHKSWAEERPRKIEFKLRESHFKKQGESDNNRDNLSPTAHNARIQAVFSDYIFVSEAGSLELLYSTDTKIVIYLSEIEDWRIEATCLLVRMRSRTGLRRSW